ncbi:MAG: hydrogenase nickel incorporation protein HypB [Clostridia bacterium]|nr:hydrogenase nickel incorporation protein HypB [Clostridia bacterium]
MDYKVILARDLRETNLKQAEENLGIFNKAGVTVINLISSPGAGKTSLLEVTLQKLLPEINIGIIEGDLATAYDADRLAPYKIPLVQINTAGACHLDAAMIRRAMEELPLEDLDLVFIENVGNLVCPAEFDLGEDAKVALLSVAEGSDKPLKYPFIFQKARLLLITKTDLLPYTNFDLPSVHRQVRQLNPSLEILPLSALTGEGLEGWYAWLKGLVHQKKAARKGCATA